MPSEKQINYTLHLLNRAGYSTKYMDASFKQLGATMRERSGLVKHWLEGLSSPKISELIDHLKGAVK